MTALIQPVKRKQCSNHSPICIRCVHCGGSILRRGRVTLPLSDTFSSIAEARAAPRITFLRPCRGGGVHKRDFLRTSLSAIYSSETERCNGSDRQRYVSRYIVPLSTAKTIPTGTFDKSSRSFRNRVRLTNPASVIPHRDDVPILSSAIIPQNSVFQAASRPRAIHASARARGLQWCPARPAGHYFPQILNMTSFISAKPTGRSLATVQDRKSFGAILS